MLPPEIVISPATKSETDSEMVKVKVDVWPERRFAGLLTIEIVGAVLSTTTEEPFVVEVTVVPAFPDKSVKLTEIETVPCGVELVTA
jgi:hypothetical protein